MAIFSIQTVLIW